MFLKRLELQGFKSFADKTVLDFSKGATAVVGPNGSGKSNISDAIRWVMGEMSAKSLRGANMQDVIFAGTQIRKPVNYAQVSLVLDNSEKVFPIDFEEVIVTRRVFRSGESVYQINKSNCRLKDIHELFMDTGLGRDGYSIIGQGNVSQILSTKAEERRSLFEEAAGVAKYKYRKEEALRKLSSVQDNLIRIQDITTELETQLAPLETQAEKARKYLLLYEEYKSLDVNLSLRTIEHNKSAAEEADRLYAAVEEELSQLRQHESETEQRLSGLYEESKKVDEQQTEKNAQLIENEARSSSNMNEISIAENNIKNNHSILARIDYEIDEIQQKDRERNNQIGEYKNAIAQSENTAQSMVSEYDVLKTEADTVCRQQEDLHNQMESLKGDIIEQMNQIASEKARIDGMQKLRNNFLQRQQAVETELESLETGRENTQKEIQEAQRKITEKNQKLQSLKLQYEKQLQQKQQLSQLQNEMISQAHTLSVDLRSKQSKKRLLEDMENSYEGYAKSVKTVLQSPHLKRLSIYGTVSGLIDVEKEYVTAIEIALGGALQNIIVETEEDAKQAIAFLRSNKAGRATFLPVSSVHGKVLDQLGAVKKEPGFVGLASELIRYEKKYDGILKSLLGRVIVVETIDHAIALSRKFGYRFRVVTLAGDVLNSGGSMAGGSVNKSSGFLSRATEIKTLGAEIAALKLKEQELEKSRQQQEKSLQSLRYQLESGGGLIREYEDQVLRLENTSSHLKQTLQSSGATKQTLAEEQKQIKQQLSLSAEEIAALLQAVRGKETAVEKTNISIQEMEEEYAKISQMRDAKNQQLMDQTLKMGSIEKDIQLAKEHIRTLTAEIDAAAHALESKRQDKERICQQNDGLYQEIRQKEQLNEQIQQFSQELKKQITSIEQQKVKVVQQMQEIQNSNKDLTERLLQLQQELSRVDTKRVKLNMEQENILNRLWEEYEITYSTAQELRKELENEKEAAKQAASLKAQIKSLGSINLDAIEEYKTVKERFEFLSTQKADLEQAKENLNKVIISMEELMEKHFGEQFTLINESFGEVFTELFGGGKGRLYLSDPEHILESGIEIEVQLPGKGLQNINLYSGGEKSFIAIALLFAILRVKPTPFCILDEIDAALDDVNVSRFATYLKNYIDQTQFIVITHRRGTMEAANVLYGVTMQEKGVSKLLSLQIDEVADDMIG